MPDVSLTASTSAAFGDAASVDVSPYLLTAGSSAAWAGSASVSVTGDVALSASSSMGMTGLAEVEPLKVISLTAATSMGMFDLIGQSKQEVRNLTGSSSMAMAGVGSLANLGLLDLTPSTSMAMSGLASVLLIRSLSLSASSSMAMAGSATVGGSDRLVSASSSMAMAGTPALSGLVFSVTATSSMGMSGVANVGRAIALTATSTVAASGVGSIALGAKVVTAATSMGMSGVASAWIAGFTATTTMGMSSLASVAVDWGGDPVAAGDRTDGPKRLLFQGVSRRFPSRACETSQGDIILATGAGPMLRWTPGTGQLVEAGLQAPSATMTARGTGVGRLVGDRLAWVWYTDERGRNGPPSEPVAFNLGTDGEITDAQLVGGVPTVTCDRPHGLRAAGQVWFVSVPGLGDGPHSVTPIDEYRLQVPGMSATSWGGGGWWVRGSATVVYENVPGLVGNAAGRMIYRTPHGIADAFYRDVDATGSTATTFQSSQDDHDLMGNWSVLSRADQFQDGPGRASPPPQDKSFLCSHMGVLFAAGSVHHDQGHVVGQAGSRVLQVVAGDWGDWCVGRQIEISGVAGEYEVLAWNAADGLATLDVPLRGSFAYARYTLSPPPAERRLVRYSEPDDPESWPPWNALAMPGESDEVVGLYSAGSQLYVVCKKVLYRMAFSGPPAETATLSLVARRGCVNGRCIVLMDDGACFLDDSGVWAQTPTDLSEPLSQAISDLFRNDDDAAIKIDWESDDIPHWHGSHDSAHGISRWFVSIVGRDKLDTALCLHHETGEWWIEQYPFEVRSSAEANFAGRDRTIVGADLRRVACLWGDTLDLAPADPASGSVSDSDATTLTDDAADFGDLAGRPVSVVMADGTVQTRIIASNTADTIEVVAPWTTPPAAGLSYVVGGVPWEWKGQWLRRSAEQTGNPQNLEVIHRPLSASAEVSILLYFDQASTPRSWSWASREDGVTVESGSPRIGVNLARTGPRPGYLAKRLEDHADIHAYGDLFLSIALAGVQASEVVRIYRVAVEGYGVER